MREKLIKRIVLAAALAAVILASASHVTRAGGIKEGPGIWVD